MAGDHLKSSPPPPADWRRLGLVTLVVLVLAAVIVVVTRDDDGDAVDAAATTERPGEASGNGSPTGADAGPDGAGDGSAAPPVAPSTTERGQRGSGETVRIAFAGDSYAEGALRSRLDRDPAGFVGPFTPVLAAADVAMLNLETAITTGGERTSKQFAFRAPPSVLPALAAGGIDVVSMANNHGLDYGTSGLQDSLATKAATPTPGIVGIGNDDAEAYGPWITEVKGQRLAFLGATQVLDSSLITAWTSGPDKAGMASAKRVDRLVAAVTEVRPQVDTVIVMVHWGVETHTCPTQDQMDLARALVDAGADIVVGGHQHRVAGGGMLGPAAIHYGLGNFLFKENSAAGARTGVFVVDVTGRDVERFEWVPGRISGSVPAPLDGAAAATALAEWEGLRSCTDLTGQPPPR